MTPGELFIWPIALAIMLAICYGIALGLLAMPLVWAITLWIFVPWVLNTITNYYSKKTK